MLLHLLRHAHAGDPYAWSGPDAERPLTDKGRAQAERVGRFLHGIGFSSEGFITSPKVRAAETAKIVADLLDLPLVADDRLAEAFDLATLEAILDDHGNPERPVIVGHDPDFSELLAVLCGAVGVPMRKGAFARIEVDRPFVPGTGTLRWLVPPDLLKPER